MQSEWIQQGLGHCSSVQLAVCYLQKLYRLFQSVQSLWWTWTKEPSEDGERELVFLCDGSFGRSVNTKAR